MIFDWNLAFLDERSLAYPSAAFLQRRANKIIDELYEALNGDDAFRLNIDLELTPASVLVDVVNLVGHLGQQLCSRKLFRGVAFTTEVLQTIIDEANRLRKPPPSSAFH